MSIRLDNSVNISSSSSGNSDYLAKFISANELGASIVYESDSKIGIGTTAPAVTLDMVAASGKNVSIYLQDKDMAHGMTLLWPTNLFGALQPSTATSGGLTITGITVNNTRTALIFNGVFGNTSTPTTAAIEMRSYKKLGISVKVLDDTEESFGIANGTTRRITVLGNGNTGFGTITPQNTIDINGGAVIGATYAGSATALTNGLLVEGNVGIANTSPSRLLDILDGTNPQVRLSYSSSVYTDLKTDSSGYLNFSPTSLQTIMTGITNGSIIHKVQNLSTGTSALADFEAHNDLGNYLVLGIGSSNYVITDGADRAFNFSIGSKGFTFGASGADTIDTRFAFGVGIGSLIERHKIDFYGRETQTVAIQQATGNEFAYQMNYTTNKLTSGNDTGLLISMTDTASPGTSLPLDIQVGSTSKFNVNNVGDVYSASKVGIGTTAPAVALEVGDGTNSALITSTGDTRWIGSGGLSYASMYTNANIATTLTLQNTWYEIDAAQAWTTGKVHNCTFTDPKITVTNAGTYLVNYSVSTSIDAGLQNVNVGIMIDSTATDPPASHGAAGIQLEGRGHAYHTSAGVIYTQSGSAVLQLAAGKTISIAAMDTSSAGKIITVQHGSITVTQIAGDSS